MVIYSSFGMNQPIWFFPYHSVLTVPIIAELIMIWVLAVLIMLITGGYQRAESFVVKTFRGINNIGSRFGL